MSEFGVAELRYEVTSRRGAESQRIRVEEMYFGNFIFKFSQPKIYKKILFFTIPLL
jgi:hypothetical protein